MNESALLSCKAFVTVAHGAVAFCAHLQSLLPNTYLLSYCNFVKFTQLLGWHEASPDHLAATDDLPRLHARAQPRHRHVSAAS